MRSFARKTIRFTAAALLFILMIGCWTTYFFLASS